MPTVEDLGRLTKQKHPEYAGMDDAEVGRRVKAKYPQYSQFTDTTSGEELAMTPQNNPIASVGRDWLGRVSEILPGAGGFAGGLLGAFGGPWGAIGGATAGGALGEAGKEALSGQKLSASGIAGQGALQGGLEATGMGLAAGAGKLAPKLMDKALKVPGPLAERFHTTAEDIAKWALQMGIPVTQEGKRIAQGIGVAAREQRSKLLSAVGGKVGAKTLSRHALADAERILGRPLTGAEYKDLIAKVQANADAILTDATHGVVPKAPPPTPAKPASTVLDQYGKPAIPATPSKPAPPSRYNARELEQIKEVAAKMARPSYKADRAALSVAADPVLSKQIASSARGTLAKVRGVGPLNRSIKESMAVGQAVGKAANRGAGWVPLRVGPVSIGAKLPPSAISKLALRLHSPKFQAKLLQSPRAVAALAALMLHSDNPDQTTWGQR